MDKKTMDLWQQIQEILSYSPKEGIPLDSPRHHGVHHFYELRRRVSIYHHPVIVGELFEEAKVHILLLADRSPFD